MHYGVNNAPKAYCSKHTQCYPANEGCPWCPPPAPKLEVKSLGACCPHCGGFGPFSQHKVFRAVKQCPRCMLLFNEVS